MAKKSFWKRGEDYAEKVSGELVEQIKRGVAPWQKPWKPGEQSTPENFSTGKKYTGGNSLYLMSRGIRDGQGDNRFGTYNQIWEAGGQVRKGERGTRVLFFTDRTARAAKDEQGKTLKDKNGKTIYEEEQRAYPVCKQYTVFNVEQADGLELKPRFAQARPEWDAHRDAEKMIEASGPTVQHVPSAKARRSPSRSAFPLATCRRLRTAIELQSIRSLIFQSSLESIFIVPSRSSLYTNGSGFMGKCDASTPPAGYRHGTAHPMDTSTRRSFHSTHGGAPESSEDKKIDRRRTPSSWRPMSCLPYKGFPRRTASPHKLCLAVSTIP